MSSGALLTAAPAIADYLPEADVLDPLDLRLHFDVMHSVLVALHAVP